MKRRFPKVSNSCLFCILVACSIVPLILVWEMNAAEYDSPPASHMVSSDTRANDPATGGVICKPLTPDEIQSALSGENIGPFISPSGPSEGQELPDFNYSGTQRYHNPYRSMLRTNRPCDGGLYADGKWVYDADRDSIYPPSNDILGCCERDFRSEFGPKGVRNETKYRWVPNKCDLIPWDMELFCRSLRGRSILMVGDSLSRDWFYSLFQMLHGQSGQRERKPNLTFETHYGSGVICEKYYPNRTSNPIRIVFISNQFLDTSPAALRNRFWWKQLQSFQILILNSGAWMVHPRTQMAVSDENYFAYMRNAASVIRRLFKGTVIWRLSYRGHPFCSSYTEPLTKVLPDSMYNLKAYERYRWHAIPLRNAYTKALWGGVGAHVLNVSLLTDLMSLGHYSNHSAMHKRKNATDCLHYCFPGALYEAWSELLLNLLSGNMMGS